MAAEVVYVVEKVAELCLFYEDEVGIHFDGCWKGREKSRTRERYMYTHRDTVHGH